MLGLVLWVDTHRIASVIWLMVLVPLFAGFGYCAIDGGSLGAGLDLFTLDPLGMPDVIEVLWFATNGFFSFIAAAFVLRSLIGFRSLWTRQEIWVSRGIFLVVYGGMIGYWVRAFTESPGVTIATPYLTMGLLSIIYGTSRFPDRFSHRREGQMEP